MVAMLKNLTRAKLIQVWFAAVVLVVVALFTLGASVTLTTGAILLALCLVPPIMTLMLWPGDQPPTVRDVLGGADRRD
jgi:hypothetical protein